jgi:hypothetical protein
LEIERCRGLKLKAMRIEIGDEGWSWRQGLKLKKATRVQVEEGALAM